MTSPIALAGIAALALALSPVAARADICNGAGGGPMLGSGAYGCAYIITYGPNGAVSTAPGAANGAPYDGIEDTLFGVVNNSGQAITSINLALAGVPLFGFDGDGINPYVGIYDPADPSGYGAGNASFTNISANYDSGTVVFHGSGIANGGVGWFSLEEAISLNQAGRLTSVPEPAGVALFGLGLTALGLFRRYRDSRLPAAGTV